MVKGTRGIKGLVFISEISMICIIFHALWFSNWSEHEVNMAVLCQLSILIFKPMHLFQPLTLSSNHKWQVKFKWIDNYAVFLYNKNKKLAVTSFFLNKKLVVSVIKLWCICLRVTNEIYLSSYVDPNLKVISLKFCRETFLIISPNRI